MKTINTSTFSDDFIKCVVTFVKPKGLRRFRLHVKNSKSSYAGRTYQNGMHSKYVNINCPLVVVRIGKKSNFPVLNNKYPKLKEAPYYDLMSREEALVHTIAHELRHVWQSKRKNHSGYFPKTRGQYSEIDAEQFALRALNYWRHIHDEN